MPALIERRKMTRATYQALKRHILREREKRKQEQEADLALERQRKEAERRKRLENENKNSLQQTKDEIVRLDKQLEDHKKEKSKLFAQLKRILETENTKKVNEKKHETQFYPPGGQTGHGPMPQFLSGTGHGTGHMGRPVMFKPLHPGIPQGSGPVHNPPSNALQSNTVKRQRSPSPTPNQQVPNVFTFPPANQPYGGSHNNKFGGQQGYNSYQTHPGHQKPGNKSQKPNISDSFQCHTLGQKLQQSVQHALSEDGRGTQQMPPQQRHSSSNNKGSIVTGYAIQSHPPPPPPPRQSMPMKQGNQHQPQSRNQYNQYKDNRWK